MEACNDDGDCDEDEGEICDDGACIPDEDEGIAP
jgi:hypothetical protein